MSLFNNREIALAIWLFVAFIFFLSKKDFRKSLSGLFKSFFRYKILISVFAMVAYTVGIIIILHKVNLWNVYLLKDSIIWFCFSGFVICFNMVASSKQENLFREIVLNNVKVIIVIEFLVGTYTFSLIGEMFFVPTMTFLGIFDFFTQEKNEFDMVSKLIKVLLSIIGLSVIIYVISHAISDYNNLGSYDTIRSVLVAPLLTISFLPLVYFILVFSAYENLFIRLDLGPEKSKELKKAATKEIIFYCKLNLKKLSRALNMNTYNIMQIRNEKDVCDMVKAYKAQV